MPEPKRARHPGEILAEEYLVPLSLSQYRLAVDTAVPPRRINEIVHGKRGITADTALRLARYFGNAPQYWMQLQAEWDLSRARERLGPRLDAEVRIPVETEPSEIGRPRRRPAAEPQPHRPAATGLADHLL